MPKELPHNRRPVHKVAGVAAEGFPEALNHLIQGAEQSQQVEPSSFEACPEIGRDYER